MKTHSGLWYLLLTSLVSFLLCAAPGPSLAGPSSGDASRTAAIDEAAAGAAMACDQDPPPDDAAKTDVSSPFPGGRNVPLMPGWPQTMGSSAPYYPVGVVLADVDGDGDLEVIAGSTDNRLRVWHHDGSLLPGWPVVVEHQIQSKAAVADLDGDGDLEIIVNVKSGSVKVFHHDGTPAAGWPQPSNLTFGFLSPTVYDLDGDGTPEILIGGGNRVSAWHADGTALAGFPVYVGSTITGTVAVGDVTGDGIPEIFVQRSNYLESFQIDGTTTPGWPVYYGMSASYAAPSIGDLDGDGSREVLVVGYAFGSHSGVFAFNGDGSAYPGFPVTFASVQTYGCPVLGDMDGDGDLEIFVAGKLDPPAFYAWDHMGAWLPGWPTPATYNMEGSAILADLDGDPLLEAAVGSNYAPGDIFGYRLDGSVVPNFPITTMGASGPNSPALGDVDLDGDLDIAFTMMSGDVAIWDLEVPYDPNAIEWGTWFHDNWNTNQHGFVAGMDPSAVPEAEAEIGIELGRVLPNPARGNLEMTFTLPVAQSVQISVVDVSGRRVRLLHEGPLTAGVQRVQWAGDDPTGAAMPEGVYFVRVVDAQGRAQTQRVVLAR